MQKTSTAIIVYNKKILFFKRDNIPTIAEPNKWQLPGGHIEVGETPLTALKRELVEEVSYVPSSLVFIGKLKNNRKAVYVFWSYVDKSEAKKFKLGKEEGQEIRFMSVNQALKQELTKNIYFYLSTFKDIITRHLEKKTIPNIKKFSSRPSVNPN